MTIRRKALSGLEHLVMEVVWAGGATTAESIREALLPGRELKDSSVRTILRRLEAKGYLRHKVDGRTFVYRSVEQPREVAARAVRHIVDRFCGGSVEELLIGMVENEVLERKELDRLVRKLGERRESS